VTAPSGVPHATCHGPLGEEPVHETFVTDDILTQRYVEIDGHLTKVLAVVKMRGSAHSTEFRRYQLTTAGAAIGAPLTGFHGITTGVPRRTDERILEPEATAR
jgi:circadian clock protein KaiC